MPRRTSHPSREPWLHCLSSRRSAPDTASIRRALSKAAAAGSALLPSIPPPPMHNMRPSTSADTDLKPSPWQWSFDESNPDVVFSGARVLFHPYYAFGTAAVRGDKRLDSQTVAYWEISTVRKLYGTSVMFGVGTDKAATRASQCFSHLLGHDSCSYGLSHHGVAHHNGLQVQVCSPLSQPNLSVGLLFDGPNRRVSYFKNGQHICTPFVDIDLSEPLYPMISSTAQRSEFVLHSMLSRHVCPSLLERAMEQVAAQCSPDHPIDTLPLPVDIKQRIAARVSKRHSREPRTPHGLSMDTSLLLPYQLDVLRRLVQQQGVYLPPPSHLQ